MKHKITLEGLFAEVSPAITNPTIEAELRQRLSYVEPDDLTTLIKFYEDSYFYSGSYNIVKSIIESYGITVDVDYKDVEVFLKKELTTKNKYRPFQEEAVNAALEKRFGIIQAPPGTGKTFIAAKITEKVNARTLIIAEDTAPYRQMIGTFKKFFNYSVGELKTKNYKVDEVSVAMLQTLISAYKRGDSRDIELFKFLEKVECLIIDEVHHIQADTYIDIIHLFPNIKYFIGLSATPYSTTGRDLLMHSIVGPVIYKITYPQTIDAGILVPTTLYTEVVPNKTQLSDHDENADAFSKHRALKEQLIMNDPLRNKMILDFVDFLNSENKSCAIIIDRVEHGKALQARYGDGLVLVEGATKEKDRELIWEKLKNKEILAIASTLIDEAVDLPSLDGVAYASGGKSRVKAIQRLRCTRTFSGETIYGKETKDRGYAYLPIDSHKNLRPHSVETRDYILDFFENHPQNEHIEL